MRFAPVGEAYLAPTFIGVIRRGRVCPAFLPLVITSQRLTNETSGQICLGRQIQRRRCDPGHPLLRLDDLGWAKVRLKVSRLPDYFWPTVLR